MYYLIKRSVDLLLALTGLLLLSPVILLVALLVAIKLGRPVLFVQERPGLHGRVFKLMKFRSMTNATDQDGELLSNAERLTPFGQRIRSLSLDELPTLWNVLAGQMSIVGPRPLLVDYLPLYSEEQAKRHQVKPGITGWAQVNGRNAINWDEKLKLDVWYVQNKSIGLDLKIFLMTIGKVIKREGITHEDDVAMPRFTGNNNNQNLKH
jgi:lipopolysaccharide/colanic/teichoic acid biosynthesis glycosyltransferase